MKVVNVLCSVAAVQFVNAATPPGSYPQVPNTLSMNFKDNLVQPDELLPQALVDAGQPTLYLPPSRKSRPSKDEHAQKQEQQKQQQKTYLFTMVDQSLPWSSLPNTTNFTSLVRGIGQNRTTRLHWFEWNVHAVPATPGHPHLLQLQNCSEPVADYQGPMPPKGDIPHDYVLYLFEQPKGYMPDQGAMARYANESDSFARMNFSIKALVDGIGAPFAANYFRVENENNTIKA